MIYILGKGDSKMNKCQRCKIKISEGCYLCRKCYIKDKHINYSLKGIKTN
jgi:hypothetical protein